MRAILITLLMARILVCPYVCGQTEQEVLSHASPEPACPSPCEGPAAELCADDCICAGAVGVSSIASSGFDPFHSLPFPLEFEGLAHFSTGHSPADPFATAASAAPCFSRALDARAWLQCFRC